MPALHLVRHARAGNRHRWDGPDELRPLSGRGERQAKALLPLLEDVGVKRILSSHYVRCVQTVQPLADALGLEVEVHPALAEEADPAEAWALAEELAGSDAALCSHGNIIGAVLEHLARRGIPLLGDECKKGSVWTVETTPDGTFTEASYIPPPV